MWIHVAALVLASSRPETPQITLGAPSNGARIEDVSVTLSVDTDAIEATVSFVLATDERDWIDTELPIAVPRGAVATALAIDSDGATFRATTVPAAAGRVEYKEALKWRRDPALLEQRDGLRLHAFPIARDKAMTVRVYLRLPRVGSLAIRAGDAPARAIAIPEAPACRDWTSEDPTARVAVDAVTALFAGPPLSESEWFVRR